MNEELVTGCDRVLVLVLGVVVRFGNVPGEASPRVWVWVLVDVVECAVATTSVNKCSQGY